MTKQELQRLQELLCKLRIHVKDRQDAAEPRSNDWRLAMLDYDDVQAVQMLAAWETARIRGAQADQGETGDLLRAAIDKAEGRKR